MKVGLRYSTILAATALMFCATARSEDENKTNGSILGQLPTSSLRIVSTIPSNGDLNPYGVAFVPEGFKEGGPLAPGDILVSNFNNYKNLQGTGTTIMKITPTGQKSVFFQGSSGIGLTTALGVLKSGFVLVGNLPTTDGTAATVQAGSLIVLDRFGHEVANLTDSTLVDGPWDLAVIDGESRAQVFVSNVLNGTVSRIDVSVDDDSGHFTVTAMTMVASGYAHRFDQAALVIGPTGLVYDSGHDRLYVASTGDNTIYAVAHPRTVHSGSGVGTILYQDNAHLHGPLGLVLASNGHLITANGDAVNAGGTPSALVEFTLQGKFVAQVQLDMGAAAAFGIAISRSEDQLRFAAVNDNSNAVHIWTLRSGD
jgi:hypothetical protein